MQLELPQPLCSASVTVEEALRTRRSYREFSVEPISLEQLSQLLWAAQGVTGKDGKKAVPSAGAQYPLRVYVVAQAVSNLSVGVHYYDEIPHSLEAVSGSRLVDKLREAALDDQPWVGTAALIIIVAANIKASQDHFYSQPPPGERGARYAYIETGALAQNVYLQATGLGVGCVMLGGFDDLRVKDALNLPQKLEPTALLCIGARS